MHMENTNIQDQLCTTIKQQYWFTNCSIKARIISRVPSRKNIHDNHHPHHHHHHHHHHQDHHHHHRQHQVIIIIIIITILLIIIMMPPSRGTAGDVVVTVPIATGMVINIIVPIMILIIAVAITPSIVISIILDPGNREGCAAVQA